MALWLNVRIRCFLTGWGVENDFAENPSEKENISDLVFSFVVRYVRNVRTMGTQSLLLSVLLPVKNQIFYN